MQQSKDYLFKKNSWISEQQALCPFDLPLFPALRSMTVLKTNSLATTVGVKTSSLAATAAAELALHSTEASSLENCDLASSFWLVFFFPLSGLTVQTALLPAHLPKTTSSSCLMLHLPELVVPTGPKERLTKKLKG